MYGQSEDDVRLWLPFDSSRQKIYRSRRLPGTSLQTDILRAVLENPDNPGREPFLAATASGFVTLRDSYSIMFKDENLQTLREIKSSFRITVRYAPS